MTAFTVGNTTSYERGLQEAQKSGKPMEKIGRIDDYDGGAVFRTIADAQAFIDRHDHPYSVYQLTLPNGDQDVDWSREAELGYGLLLTDAVISPVSV